MQQGNNPTLSEIMERHNVRQQRLLASIMWFWRHEHELKQRQSQGDGVAGEVVKSLVTPSSYTESQVDRFTAAVETYCQFKGQPAPWSVEV